MIIVIDALNRHEFRDVLDDMFRLRARVFGDRLGWDVKIENGREIDEFDGLDPAYVIGLDDEGHVISCARALQTTGPHMLSDVFSAILNGEPPLRSATVWESTRFCVDTDRLRRPDVRHTVSSATCELMIGALEFCRGSGISDIITVIDPVMDRVLKRSDNAPYGYVGQTVPMGKVSAMAALIDCTEERIARVRAFSGIQHDVFADEADLRRICDARREKERAPNVARSAAFAAPDTAAEDEVRPVTRADLWDYCKDQMTNAVTLDERRAAYELFAHLFDRADPQQIRRVH